MTAVFASQRRWGIFVCMNKNCSGSLKLTQTQSNPAASVTTVCLPFHPLTSFTSWLDKTHNFIFISVSRKDELAIKPFICPTGEGDTNKKMKKSGLTHHAFYNTSRTVTARQLNSFSGEFYPRYLNMSFNAEFISTLSHNNGKCIQILKQKTLLLRSIKHWVKEAAPQWHVIVTALIPQIT